MPAPTAGPADGHAVLAALPSTVPAYFGQAQHTLANHRKNIVALHRQHHACATVAEETPRGLRLVGEKAFNDAFLGCLNRVLGVKRGVANADRCIKFVAAYSSYAQEQFRMAAAHEKRAQQGHAGEDDQNEEDDDEEEDTPATRFVTILLRHLLRGFGAKNKSVRLRCCQSVALLINGLESVDDDLFETLKKSLLVRLRDKESSVRVQAVIALAKLQGGEVDGGDDTVGASGSTQQQPITSLIVHALRHDPSAEVRRAALFNLTPSAATLPYILERLQDVDVLNRRCVYLGSLSNAVLQQADCQIQLTTDDWARVVKTGLGEREQSVMRAVKKLMASWVDADNGTGAAERFLHRFSVGAAPDVALMALKAAFEVRSTLLDSVSIDEDFWQDLTPQRALLARAFAEHCSTLGAAGDKRMEDTMPLVTALAFRVQAAWGSLLELLEQGDETDAADDASMLSAASERQSAMDSLLHVAMRLDYGDEIGRRKMFGLVRDMVSTSLLPETLVGTCLDVLRKLSAGQKDFVRIIVEIVQEIEDVIEMEEAADSDDEEEAEIEEMMGEKSTKSPKHTPEQLAEQAQIDSRRLIIVAGMLERVAGGMQENTAMHGLVSQLIAPAVKSRDPVVRERGLKCLGLCCLLDTQLAVNTFGLFLQQTEQAEGSVRQSCIEIVFDLLSTHGIAFLCQPQIHQAGGDDEAVSAVHGQVVNFLLSLLEDDDMGVQAVAAEGMAKLMLTGVVEEDDALRSLVLVYMSPETSENQALRQCLSYFLPMYCYSSATNQRRLQRVFIPVLDVLTEVYYESDGAQEMVTPLQVGMQLIDWCEPSKALYDSSNDERATTIPIDMAIEMVQSLFTKEAKEDRRVLCQLLGKVVLPDEEGLHQGTNNDSAVVVLALFVLIGTLQQVRPLEDATSSRNLAKFQLGCKRLYPTLWARVRSMDLATAPALNGVRAFVEECGYDAEEVVDAGDDGSVIEAATVPISTATTPRRPSSRATSTASRRTASTATSRITSTASSVTGARERSRPSGAAATPRHSTGIPASSSRRRIKQAPDSDDEDMSVSLAQRIVEGEEEDEGEADDASGAADKTILVGGGDDADDFDTL